MSSQQMISFMADRKAGLKRFLRECLIRESWDEAIYTIQQIKDVEHQIKVGQKIRELVENDPDVRDLRRRETLRLVPVVE